MLSETLPELPETDTVRMQNLFRGISRVMLSLARQTQSHIGSLRFNDDGSTTLSNRPILCTNTILESEGAPRTVNRTYTTLGSFIDDMIQFRDEAFRAQPNAVHDEEDCRLQMLHMVLLRLLKHHFIDSQSEGPFVLQFTDFHPSNIFVDDQWNIVALIDFEFTCALPPSMMTVPYWLKVDAIDEVCKHMHAFRIMHNAFLDHLREEEGRTGSTISLAQSIQEAWDTDSCWFYRCLTSVNGMPCCLEDHIYKKFGVDLSVDEERSWAKTMSAFWSLDSEKDVMQKVRDKAEYDKQMELHFRTFLNTTDDSDALDVTSAAV